jgi:hypothetical protein
MGMAYSWAVLNDQPNYQPLIEKMKPEIREMFESATRDFPSPSSADIERATVARRAVWDVGVRSWLRIRELISLSLVFLSAVALMSSLLAFALRGNLTYLMVGITIQTTDGRRAGRFRVLGRSLISWSPVIVYLVFLRISSFSWEEWLSIPVALLVLAGAIYAVARPSLGLQDRLAGTQLQPR